MQQDSGPEKVILDLQAQCGCGWRGKPRYTHSNAEGDMIAHVRQDHAIDIEVRRLGTPQSGRNAG